jgi:two-component system chemotaxis response regulator CheY
MPTTRPRGPEGRTILVVDDQDLVRDVVMVMLESRGFGVRVAPDGPAAVAAFTADPVDAVLVDMDMPRMNGLEVCRALRRVAEQLGRPFCAWLMTGVLRPDLKARAIAAGARGVIGKPFTTAELLARVEQLFSDPELPQSAA